MSDPTTPSEHPTDAPSGNRWEAGGTVATAPPPAPPAAVVVVGAAGFGLGQLPGRDDQ